MEKSSITRSGITEPLDVKLFEEYDYNLKRKSCIEYFKVLMFIFVAIGLYYAGWANYLMNRIDEYDASACFEEGALMFPKEPEHQNYDE